MISTILLLLLGVTYLHAARDYMELGACKDLSAIDNDLDAKWATEFLKEKMWGYKYIAVKREKGEPQLSTMKATIKPLKDGKVELETSYQIASYKIPTVVKDTIQAKGKEIVSVDDTNGDNVPDTKLVILKYETGKYFYFYKCSTKPDANKDLDARFVIADHSPLTEGEKKEIEDLDKSYVSNHIFKGEIYYIV